MNQQDQHEHMRNAVDYLKDYIETYDKQHGYLDYTDKMLIDDILYGLGVAIDAEEYRFADGYEKFKDYLRLHLNT